MEQKQSLTKIRSCIKYGRIIRADIELHSLLIQIESTNQEIIVLEVHALELLQDTKSYNKAAPLLERLLSLNISDDLRKRAREFLSRAKIAFESCFIKKKNRRK